MTILNAAASETGNLKERIRQLMQAGPVVGDDGENMLKTCILAFPQDRLIAEDIYDHLRQHRSAAAATDWLAAVQEHSPSALRGVLQALAAAMGGRSAVRERLGAKLDALALSDPFPAIARIWQAMIDGAPLPPDDVKTVKADKLAAHEIYFQFMAPPPEILPLWGEEAALARHGIEINALRDFMNGFLKPAARAWQMAMDDSPKTNQLTLSKRIGSENGCGFLDRIVADGNLSLSDPLTGKPVLVSDSVIIFGKAIYTFRGKEWCFLLASGPWSGAAGIYIPRLNVAITFDEVLGRHMEGDRFNALPFLFRRAVNRKTPPPQNRTETATKKVALHITGIENFAHHIWNYLSALERLCMAGSISNLASITYSGSEFFGPLAEIFPEIASIPYSRPTKAGIIDPFPDAQDGLVVPSGGAYIPARLTDRVVRYLAGRPKLSSSVSPEDLPNHGRPVIWIGCRLNDKAWSDQETGAVELMEILLRRFPSALFLLDGFSYPVGEDLISSQWTDFINEIDAMCTRMKAAVSRPDQVVNMVGNTFRESVLWAQQTDVYLAPYGSTQHKIGWFTDAPGLVYLPPVITEDIALQSPGFTASEISTAPVMIWGQPVSQGARRGIYRSREKYENVTLNVDEIAAILEDMIRNRFNHTK